MSTCLFLEDLPNYPKFLSKDINMDNNDTHCLQIDKNLAL